MRSPPIHRLTFDLEQTFTHRAKAFLALTSESYPGFVGERIDLLDLRAHLQRQTQALTVLAWDVRQPVSRIQLVVIPENEPLERFMPSGRQAFAQGWLRTFGRICLSGNERLESFARDRDYDFIRADDRTPRPHVLDVPPGTYLALVYTGRESAVKGPHAEPPSDIVILRHYPFPPPRVAPVRLAGRMFSDPSAEAAETGSPELPIRNDHRSFDTPL
jgi:hypothetical protein